MYSRTASKCLSGQAVLSQEEAAVMFSLTAVIIT